MATKFGGFLCQCARVLEPRESRGERPNSEDEDSGVARRPRRTQRTGQPVVPGERKRVQQQAKPQARLGSSSPSLALSPKPDPMISKSCGISVSL